MGLYVGVGNIARRRRVLARGTCTCSSRLLSVEYEKTLLEWFSVASSATGDGADTPMITSQAEADRIRGKRDEVAEKLRSNYWQLDPYIRARSVYDKTG